jgi:hypothetical protein
LRCSNCCRCEANLLKGGDAKPPVCRSRRSNR